MFLLHLQVGGLEMNNQRLRAIRELFLARLREYYRETETIFWSFVFPILLATALAIAFRNKPAEQSRALIISRPGAAQILQILKSSSLIKADISEESTAAAALMMGRVDVVITPPETSTAEVVYRFDPSRPEAEIARLRIDNALQLAFGRTAPLKSKEIKISEPGSRYIDFLIPGLIGMNLLSAGMWGIGFVLVDMRIKKLLKRLIVTPMHPSDFLAAQLSSRLLFSFLEVAFLLVFSKLVFNLPIRGSILSIFIVAFLGSLSFASLGILAGSRAKKIETVSGLINLIMLPMFIGSGVFFSIERFPDTVKVFLRLLPLTALIDALRAIILEGAALSSQWIQIVILIIWGITSFVIGLKLFRWN